MTSAFDIHHRVEQCQQPVGVAKDLLAYTHVQSALGSVPHLGSLADMVDVSASRLDYVRLWIDALSKIKHRYPGLGLSASYSRSRERRDGLTKLEILQLWVILANCGHLFRTFSTERALLYILSKNTDERNDFLGFLERHRSDSPIFRNQCDSIVSRGDYLSFFYVLAAWRLFAGDLKDVPSSGRVQAAWKAYFETYNGSDERSKMMQWLFRKSRQIVTAYIHSLMGIGPSITVGIDGLIGEIFHSGSIVGYSSGLAETDVSHHLGELESLHLKIFFASPEANLRALQDMRACKQWWEARSSSSVQDRVMELFRGPKDWPKHELAPIPPFCRLYLPTSSPRQMWLREVERWKDMGWTSGEFVISLIGRSALVCDLYMSDEGLDLRGICRTASVMASKSDDRQGHDKESRQRMEASIANFAARLLSCEVNKRGLITIRPTECSADGECGLAVLAPSTSVAAADVRSFARMARDDVRTRELMWFSQYEGKIASSRKRTDEVKAVLVFLGRLVLLDRHDEREITDIDLVLAEFFDDTIIWTLCQLKGGTQSGGGQQLNALRDYVPSLGDVERVSDCGSEKCWIARICQRA